MILVFVILLLNVFSVYTYNQIIPMDCEGTLFTLTRGIHLTCGNFKDMDVRYCNSPISSFDLPGIRVPKNLNYTTNISALELCPVTLSTKCNSHIDYVHYKCSRPFPLIGKTYNWAGTYLPGFISVHFINESHVYTNWSTYIIRQGGISFDDGSPMQDIFFFSDLHFGIYTNTFYGTMDTPKGFLGEKYFKWTIKFDHTYTKLESHLLGWPGNSSYGMEEVLFVDRCIPDVNGTVDSFEISGNQFFQPLLCSSLYVINGDMTITENPGLSGISLPDLKEVTGSITIDSNLALKFIILPSLSTAWYFRLKALNALHTLELPNLRFVAWIFIDKMGQLQDVHFPVLIENWLTRIWNSPKLLNFSAPKSSTTWWLELVRCDTIDIFNLWQSVNLTGQLEIMGNSQLKIINAPVLNHVGKGIFITQNNVLQYIRFPSLKRVGYLRIGSNTELEILMFPVVMLIDIHVSILHNTALTTVEFPLLKGIGDFILISYNHALRNLEFPLLVHISNKILFKSNHFLDTINLCSFDARTKVINITNNGKHAEVLMCILPSNTSLQINEGAINLLCYCPNIIQHELTDNIRSPTYSTHDTRFFKHIRVLHGHINISNSLFLLELEFTLLHSISRDLMIYNNEKLVQFMFTELSFLGGDMYIEDNKKMKEFYFDMLTSVHGHTSINGNSKLNKISFPELNNITGSIYIRNNVIMRTISFPHLTSLKGGVYIDFDKCGTTVILQVNDMFGAALDNQNLLLLTLIYLGFICAFLIYITFSNYKLHYSTSNGYNINHNFSRRFPRMYSCLTRHNILSVILQVDSGCISAIQKVFIEVIDFQLVIIMTYILFRQFPLPIWQVVRVGYVMLFVFIIRHTIQTLLASVSSLLQQDSDFPDIISEKSSKLNDILLTVSTLVYFLMSVVLGIFIIFLSKEKWISSNMCFPILLGGEYKGHSPLLTDILTSTVVNISFLYPLLEMLSSTSKKYVRHKYTKWYTRCYIILSIFLVGGTILCSYMIFNNKPVTYTLVHMLLLVIMFCTSFAHMLLAQVADVPHLFQNLKYDRMQPTQTTTSPHSNRTSNHIQETEKPPLVVHVHPSTSLRSQTTTHEGTLHNVSHCGPYNCHSKSRETTFDVQCSKNELMESHIVDPFDEKDRRYVHDESIPGSRRNPLYFDQRIVLMMQHPSVILIKNHKRRFRTFRRSFVGREFVTWMVDMDMASNRYAAVKIGERLIENELIFPISTIRYFEDGNYLYTLKNEEKQNQESA